MRGGGLKGGERGHVPGGWRDNRKKGRVFVPEKTEVSSRSKVELGVLNLDDNLNCKYPSATRCFSTFSWE